MPEAIIKYSQLVEDDGGFDQVEQDLENLGKRLVQKTSVFKKELQFIDVKDIQEIRRLEAELTKITKAYTTLQKQKSQVDKSRKKSAELTQKEVQAIEDEREAQRKSRAEARALAKLKATQAGSIEELRAKLSVVTIEWAKLSEEERENTNRGERLVRVKKDLTEELKKLERATGDNRRNVGNYREEVKLAIKELQEEKRALQQTSKELVAQQSDLKKGSAEWLQYQKRIDQTEDKLKSINTELGEADFGAPEGSGFDIPNLDLGGGLSSISSGFGNLLSSIGPVGIAIGGVVAGVTALGSAVLDVEQRFTDLKNTASGLNLGSQLEEVVVNTVALSDTFGDDQNEVLRTQNVLIKEFGINAESAFQILELGYLSGANANGELTESILEYSSQIRDAGGDQEDLLKILQKSNQEGIFSDKGIDVVKEFGLRIREQTDSTKDALEGAFGKKFTKDLFDGLNDGSITSVDALARVSKGLNDTRLTAQQTQTVVADVFGGPGEDAGLRFLKSLQDINEETNKYIDLGDPIIRGQREQARLSKELAEAQNRVAKQFEGSGQAITNFGIKAKTVFFEVVGGIGDFATDISDGFSNLFNFEDATVQAAGFKQVLDNFTPSLGGLTDEWLKLTDAERAAVATNKAANEVSEVATEIIKDEIFDINNKVSALEDENLTQEERNELLEELLDKYPQYQDELVDEEGNVRDLTKARGKLNKAIIESALARAKEAVFTQAINDLIEKQLDVINEQQKLRTGDIGITDVIGFAFSGTAQDDLEDQKDLLTALTDLDLDSLAEELEGIFSGFDLDAGQTTFADSISEQLEEIEKLELQLSEVNTRLNKTVDESSRVALEEQAESLEKKIEALRKVLESTKEGQRALLELGDSGAGGDDDGATGTTGDSASKIRDKELDLIEEIRRKRADLLEEGLIKELQIIDNKIDAELKGFEKLRTEQQKIFDAGIISPELFQSRIDQINEISRLAEEQRAKQSLEIRDKLAEEEKKRKISELQELNQLELSTLQADPATTQDQINQQLIESLNEEIRLRRLLGAVSVEERQALIDLELKLIQLSKQLGENEADAIRALEEVQVQGQIDEVERQIKAQEELITESGAKAGEAELNQLRALVQQRFDLRRRAIEDEFDYQLSKVEEGSLEEQRIIEEKNNALAKLEQENADAIADINDRRRQQEKDKWQEFVNELKNVLSQVLDQLEANAEKEVELAEDRVQKQGDAVDEQRARAEQGLANTLAFEKEEEAKREAEKIRSEKRLENIRKVKTFYNNYNARLNSLKEGEDASKALFGALKDLAIVEAITASFGEGGITGVDGYKKVRTTSKGITIGRSHSMKGGVPAMFEGGEGFFSKQEVDNLGHDGFYQLKQIAGNRALAKNMFGEQRKAFVKAVPPPSFDPGIKDELIEMKEAIREIEGQKLDIVGFVKDFLRITEEKYKGGKLKEINHITIKTTSK